MLIPVARRLAPRRQQTLEERTRDADDVLHAAFVTRAREARQSYVLFIIPLDPRPLTRRSSVSSSGIHRHASQISRRSLLPPVDADTSADH